MKKLSSEKIITTKHDNLMKWTSPGENGKEFITNGYWAYPNSAVKLTLEQYQKMDLLDETRGTKLWSVIDNFRESDYVELDKTKIIFIGDRGEIICQFYVNRNGDEIVLVNPEYIPEGSTLYAKPGGNYPTLIVANKRFGFGLVMPMYLGNDMSDIIKIADYYKSQKKE